MSLLLDALKKAAEQKAGKDKGERPGVSSSDETIIDPPAEDLTEISDGEDSTLSTLEADRSELDSTALDTRYQQTEFEDDRTELDATALNTDFQKTEFESDETAIDSAENDLDKVEFDSSGSTAGEQKTQIDLDKTEADRTDTKTQFEQTSVDLDKTEIENDAANTDKTEIDSTEADTRYQQSEQESDTTNLTQAEETYVSTVMGHSGEDETLSSKFDEDETIVFGEDDVTSFMGDPIEEARREISRSVENQTELETYIETTTETETETETYTETKTETETYTERANDTQTDLVNLEADEDISTTGDISLTLLKQEDDTTTASDPDRNPHRLNADTDLQILGTDQTSTDGLNLVEIPDDGGQTDTQRPAVDSTSVTGITNTITSRGASSDSTSTQTYAPDNYDRTLMKLPNDDASMLFAGMKSEADVVMTPDYAKKVFLSKSSANRLQFYKIYAVIASVILLSVFIIGLFELQIESEKIDTSLRPLKRDPLPGVIKSANTSIQPETLFNTAADEVDLKTIALVENVKPETDDQAVADVAETTQVKTAADTAGADSAAQKKSTQQGESNQAVISTPIATAQTSEADSGQGSSTLQISSSRRADEKDVLLSEAFSAYSQGSDALALSKYNQVLDLDPENRNALLARAAINIQNNNSQAAIKDYQAILLVNPKDSLAMTSMIAVASFSPRETESQLKLMIRDEPESPHLNFALANVYGGQGRWQEAQNHYFKALENNPNDPNYAYNLAVSLEHISKPKVAVPYYQRALRNINNGLATFNKDIVSQRLEMLGKL